VKSPRADDLAVHLQRGGAIRLRFSRRSAKHRFRATHKVTFDSRALPNFSFQPRILKRRRFEIDRMKNPTSIGFVAIEKNSLLL
jgi:hypothetical protein